MAASVGALSLLKNQILIALWAAFISAALDGDDTRGP